jgi:hypothetical protein
MQDRECISRLLALSAVAFTLAIVVASVRASVKELKFGNISTSQVGLPTCNQHIMLIGNRLLTLGPCDPVQVVKRLSSS